MKCLQCTPCLYVLVAIGLLAPSLTWAQMDMRSLPPMPEQPQSAQSDWGYASLAVPQPYTYVIQTNENNETGYSENYNDAEEGYSNPQAPPAQVFQGQWEYVEEDDMGGYSTQPPLVSPPGRVETGMLIPKAETVLPEDYFDLQKKKIFRWNDQTRNILVYIADGSHLSGWRPQNSQLVQTAFQEWEQAMEGRFHFIFMPDERGSDVKVKWETRITDDSSGEAAGINETTTWGKYISKNDIVLALYDQDGRALPDTMIHWAALHEIGHMLGLKAHSDRPKDIMFPSNNPIAWMERQHLSQRDINTLKRVYVSKADYVTPEGYHLSDFKQFKKQHGGRGFTLLWIPIPGVPFPVPIPLPF